MCYAFNIHFDICLSEWFIDIYAYDALIYNLHLEV